MLIETNALPLSHATNRKHHFWRYLGTDRQISGNFV